MEHLNQPITALQAVWLTISALCLLLSAFISAARGRYTFKETPRGLRILDIAFGGVTVIVITQAYQQVAGKEDIYTAIFVIAVLATVWGLLWDLSSAFHHGRFDNSGETHEIRIPSGINQDLIR